MKEYNDICEELQKGGVIKACEAGQSEYSGKEFQGLSVQGNLLMHYRRGNNKNCYKYPFDFQSGF